LVCQYDHRAEYAAGPGGKLALHSAVASAEDSGFGFAHLLQELVLVVAQLAQLVLVLE
jgi:hypothetical protein